MSLRSFSALSILLAAATFSFGSGAAPEAPPRDPQRPTLVTGAVERVADGVRVGSDGAEWVMPGGSRVTASLGAELRVLGVPQPVVLAGNKKVPGYTVLVRSGLVRAHVPGNGKSAVILAAPKNTSLLVFSGQGSVVAGRQVAVANAGGVASVGSGGEPFRALEPGTVEVVEGGTGVRRPLVAPPSLLRGSFVVISHGADASLGEIAWDPVPEADGYRVELHDAASGGVVARTRVGEARLAPGFARMPPGKYTLSVASVDRTGLESGKPAEQPVGAIGLALPAGGYVDGSGIVRFPAGSSLALSNVEGVEMTYGSARLFVATPPKLELLAGEPRLVRFRMSGSVLDSPVWLVPRDARARIEFGPKAPRWPDAPLEIRIRVEDARGQAAPDFIQARPRVLVGLDRADVTFSRRGEWLRGVLPAQKGKGPWVVRVEVEDQNGIALGRDFVEIVGATSPPRSKKGS